MKTGLRLALVLSVPVSLLCDRTVRAQAPSTTRASVDSGGVEANGVSAFCALSYNGRFVGFESSASNLVAGDTNGGRDVFVRDRVNATTERVSVSTGGVQGNLDSGYPSLSSDGRFVAFYGGSTNLVAGDTNSSYDVFVRDRQNGTTERVSLATGGAQLLGDSDTPSISGDGRFVAFHSTAEDAGDGDANGSPDIFLRDRQSGTTVLVSVSSSGVQGNGGSSLCSISSDGRYVAFQSDASNLVAGDTNFAIDVFVHDRTTGATERASVDSSGVQGNSLSGAPLYAGAPTLSADGRFVAFMSYASNLVASDTNGFPDIFVRDRTSSTTERASVAMGTAQPNQSSFYPSISGDGRFVVFESSASNLVAADTNALADVFVRDRASGTTERASVTSAGVQANSASQYSAISGDGHIVPFQSFASNLVTGDTNNLADVFVRDRGVPPPAVYCTSGTSSAGCSASIAANANPSVSFANACQITVINVDGQRTGIVFYGLTRLVQPWCSLGGGSSYLCVKTPTLRTGVQNSGGTNGACNGSFALDWNAFQLGHPGALGAPWSAGSQADVQAWYRDPPACKTTGLSNAVELTYLP